MASRKSEALDKPGTVAYLVANTERLTRQGAFTGQPAARTVFLHLCFHPGGTLPPYDKRSAWECRVAAPSYDPGDITAATGLTRRTVDRALDWLAAEGFIDLDRKGTGPRRRYGAVTIIATGRSSDWKHRYKDRYGHHVLMHPLPPANGHGVLNKDMVSLSDDSQAVEEPPKPRRTVATRENAPNLANLPSSGTLKSAGEARNAPVMGDPPANVPGEYPGPATRPDTELREAQASVEAGPVPIGDPLGIGHTATPDRPSKRLASPVGHHEARNCPGADADVDRVMALLSDLPGWDTATARSPGQVREREAQAYVRPGLPTP